MVIRLQIIMKPDDIGNRMVIIIHKKKQCEAQFFPISGSGVVYEMHILVGKPIQIAKPDSA